jgi:hypothetical protein
MNTNQTKCSQCKKSHFLRDEDAGSEREIQRLCVACHKHNQECSRNMRSYLRGSR